MLGRRKTLDTDSDTDTDTNTNTNTDTDALAATCTMSSPYSFTKVDYSPEVKACMEKLKEQYGRDMHTVPPVPMDRLITAVMVHEARVLTREEIFAGLGHLFSSLGLKAEILFDHRSPVYDALYEYDSGLKTIPSTDSKPKYHTVTEYHARCIFGVNSGTNNCRYDFLDLPPELRVHVYDYLLQAPKSGITISNRAGICRPYSYGEAYVVSRDPYATAPLIETVNVMLDEPGRSLITTNHLPCVFSQSRLNILRVNKLIYREAKAVFYGKNLFHGGPHLTSAHTVLTKNIADSTRPDLRHFSFKWDDPQHSFKRNDPQRQDARSLVTALSNTQVKTLRFWIEKAWFPKRKHPKTLPGITELCGYSKKLQKLSVETRDWPELVEYLRQHCAGACEVEGVHQTAVVQAAGGAA